MEYVTGDRFSPEFLEKRRASLQLFIDRINRHSILSTSPYYQKFLQADQMVLVSSSDHQAIGDTVRDSNVFDNIGEVFINAFTKVKTPDDKYVEMKEGIDKFENNLVNIEKIHVKMLKTQTELGHEFQLLGGAIESLGKMETQITEPLNEFGQGLLTYAQLFKDKVTAEDLDYCTGIHEFIAYCEAAKETLKLRDQKQVDFEELTRFLNANSSERDRTMSTGKSPGISGFFKDKINDFKGVDPEKARQERLSKLDAKIDDLKTAVNQSEETAQKFSTQVTQEFELFNNVKLYDFKELFRSYTDTQLAFHEKGAQFWESMLNVVDGIQIAPSPVIQE
ncbi:intercellular trafficking and secretion [Boothiomyces macroporosus]|uniref:Sorting nexin-4 n=1 Tax=Boothiomyces macroporosus TaxID=261099 RepID=A0AAD5Y450_9FUNG|nr:intercellular trafficking and secretion [Boothiomyces macroporosus]